MKLIDRTGQRYGRLLVIRKDPTPRMWLCQCDCGATKLVSGSALAQSTRSCGCLASEWASHMGSNPEFVERRIAKTTKHGHKRGRQKTAEYKTWLGIKRRCYDTKCKDYPDWGGRGVTVCDRWRHDFCAFLADMGLRPPDKTSIDRLDGSKGYEPGNCRWATSREQDETKRTNLRVSFGGVEYNSLREACAVLQIKYTTVWQRVKAGYTAQDALAIGASRPPSRRTRESYWRKSHRDATPVP